MSFCASRSGEAPPPDLLRSSGHRGESSAEPGHLGQGDNRETRTSGWLADHVPATQQLAWQQSGGLVILEGD